MQATPRTEINIPPNTIILSPPHGKIAIKLGEGDVVVLGRQRSADYRLIDLTNYFAIDYGVSRVHARLWRKNNQLWIEDLGSSNGTWLNDVRLAPHVPCLLNAKGVLVLAAMSISVLIADDYQDNLQVD